MDETGWTAASFEALYDTHGDAVFALFARRVGRDVAEDLTAQTFLEAWSVRDRYDPLLGTKYQWLWGIAMNILRHHFRGEERRGRAMRRTAGQRLPDYDEFDRVGERLAAAQQLPTLAVSLERLRDDDRELLHLHACKELSYPDIARRLDIPVGTVRSRLSRARTKLSRSMGARRGGTVMTEDLRMTSDERERVRARLRAGMGATSGDAARVADPRRARLVLAAALVLVVGAAAVTALDRDDPQVATGSGADVALAEVAERALIRPADEEVGRYRHLVVQRSDPDHPAQTWIERIWVANDGTGRLAIEAAGTERDEVRTYDDPGDPVPASVNYPGLLDALAGPDLSLAGLEAASGDGTTARGLVPLLIDLLAWPDIDAPVRSQVLRLLDTLGFEPIGPITDPTGRLGAGYRGAGPDGGTIVFVVDPDTTDLHSWSSGGTTSTTDLPPGTHTVPVSRSTTYLHAERTDSMNP